MTDLKFTDRMFADDTRLTKDGYLLVNARVARTGVQVYDGRSLGRDDMGQVNVYRGEDVVFDRASMATFAGKPVTRGHPDVLVDASNWSEYAAGEIGEDVVRDGEYVRVPFMIRDAATIEAATSDHREISMGYTSGLEWGDGVAPDGTPYQARQTGPLRINHLAVVPRARGGKELRIGDGADKWGASPFTDAHKETSMTTRKIMVDGLEVETTDAGAAAITKLQGTVTAAEKRLTDADTAHKAAIDAKDKELATKDAEIEGLKKAQMSDADIDKRVVARAKLLADAAKIDKDVKADGLSDVEIRKAVVSAKLDAATIADKSDAYIEARFDALVEAAGQTDAVADAIKGKAAPAGALNLDQLRAERDRKLAEGYLNKKEA